MKKMKKTAAMLMAATVAVAMPMTAMAASITVDTEKGFLENQTYKAYKIFDYTSTDENATDDSEVAYTIEANSEWKSDVEAYTYGGKKAFTLTASKGNPNVYVVEVNSEITYNDAFAADFAEYLSKKAANKTRYSTANTNKEFENLEKGYYFVNTTTGSLCSLVNSDSEQTLKEKNSLPTVEKTADKETASIGDTVTYTITVTDGEGTQTPITIHDKAESGLIVDTTNISVKKVVNGVESNVVNSGEKIYYTTATTGLGDGCTFELTLSKDLVTELDARTGSSDDDKVVITYTAKMGSETEIYDPETADSTNDNSVSLTYYNNYIPGNTVCVATYKFDVVKTDMDLRGLTGAKFKLYRSLNGNDEIKVIKETNGVYRVAANEDEKENAVEIEAGLATVKGLGNSTYYLEETAAPKGYNPLTARQALTISDGNLVVADPVEGVYSENAGVVVQNNHGTILPSTGGIGTTVFYAAGIVVMAGAVFFVVRSKKHE